MVVEINNSPEDFSQSNNQQDNKTNPQPDGQADGQDSKLESSSFGQFSDDQAQDPNLNTKKNDENPESPEKFNLTSTQGRNSLATDNLSAFRTSALAKREKVSVFTLPQELTSEVTKTIRTEEVGLISRILSDQNLVSALLKTQMWSNSEELRKVLKAALLGEATAESIQSIRELTQTLQHGDRNSPIKLIVADSLMNRQNSNSFQACMGIANEVLHQVDPDLTLNLNGLLSTKLDIQERSFKWLFERMLMHAEQDFISKESYEVHLLKARIIFKQLLKVLQFPEEAKWTGLQTHIVMAMAGRLVQEHRSKQKPLAALLLMVEEKLAQDFVRAVDSNFGVVYPHIRQSKEQGNVGGYYTDIVKKYGGYENYEQAMETVIAFGVMNWPDQFYEYLRSRYEHADDTIKSNYLNCMKYALYRSTADNCIEAQFHSDRLSFIVQRTISLAVHPAPVVQNRLQAVFDYNPFDLKVTGQDQPHLLAYEVLKYVRQEVLDENNSTRVPFYETFNNERRKFLTDFFLRSAGFNQTLPKELVLPCIIHELKLPRNVEIQKQILRSSYFSKDFVSQLDQEQSAVIRNSILSKLEEFVENSDNNIMLERISEIFSCFGITAIQECFEDYKKASENKKHRAELMLSLLGSVARRFASTSAEEIAIFNNCAIDLANFTQNAIITKRSTLERLYMVQNKMNELGSKALGLNEQNESVTQTALAVNEKVSKLDQEQNTLQVERRGIRSNLKTSEGSLRIVDQEIQNKEKELQLELNTLSYSKQIIKKIKLFNKFFQSDNEKKIIEELNANKNERQELLKQKVSQQARVGQIDERLKQIAQEKPKAEKEQVAMTEAYQKISKQSQINKTQLDQCINLEPKLKTEFESIRNTSLSLVSCLRMFIDSATLGDELAKKLFKLLQLPTVVSSNKSEDQNLSGSQAPKQVHDGLLIILRLELGIRGKLPNPAGVVQSELKLLSRNMEAKQILHGNYSTEFKYQLTAVLKQMHLEELPISEESNNFFTMLYKQFELRRFQNSEADETTKLSSALERMRTEHNHLVVEIVQSVLKVSGATNSEPQAILEFLRSKFPYDNDLDNDTSEAKTLFWVFILTAIFDSPEAAVKTLFYMLAGDGGSYFVKPEKLDRDPITRAESIDARYYEFYTSLKNLKTKSFEINQQLFRLIEGKAWKEDINDLAGDYFVHIFNQTRYDHNQRKQAEIQLVQNALIPWSKWDEKLEQEYRSPRSDASLNKLWAAAGLNLAEDEKARAKLNKKERPKKLAMDDCVLLNLAAQYTGSANIPERRIKISQAVTQHETIHSPQLYVEFAINFVKRVNNPAIAIHSNYLKLYKEILQNLKNTVEPTILYKIGDDKEVELGGMLDLAYDLIEDRLASLEATNKRHVPRKKSLTLKDFQFDNDQNRGRNSNQDRLS